ncbi:MAG: hydroxylamine reductase [Candidatus Schekmanbacteria bacterium RIFCSPHIGHO2_02_FULL_38_11]|uniref:Hydroxylamine reductase n=1 Tax=Candidatus Schekmanbacteria bacterium RIFCSPLOWO2_12_FULL_38_15 TaxID=1817883 RepID=A0A1F7SHT3_9BACT|nr:MAG: hydroxylamine reductase [Candidatus Schekmanbacteria bacterium RIFCSPLOWO2_02_FULL_38_14]OGL53291.1 MAG: hydroxylamine reductase [Candidatus Schekmanbacteria bacterium RIFCSPLOWO2_12_FULL_38_15]OGL53971.1 MAG: hydroxylamine reductase [Candidatus Schekmanbacteria bacterium RIFCSPHIGHO2_02_FULL_38_11]
MFCYQCEQTPTGGCTKIGVCGKNEDVASLQDTLLFGLKGIAAYGFHARELGASDPEIDSFMYEALFSTVTNVDFDAGRFVKLVLKCGEMNLKVMKLLDEAHTKRFGNPVPTEVTVGTKKGKGIVVTGHDLLDLYELLKQTEGKGINVYTHSEMLPAHGYPELKKFKHLAGNYGGTWHSQKDEFEKFSGAILGTTNCVMPPKESYKDRFFTCGITGLDGVKHIEGRNFKAVIDKALSLPELPEAPGKKIMTGFHHTAILGIADKVIGAVKAGKIKRFFLIGGCDAPGKGGEYFTEFAKLVPKDCVILTLACGKYRINNIDYGNIDGIPRLIDIGQCNNSYSAVQVAVALAGAFNCGVNDLPLSLVLSWFEQKAVAILLSLLNLGIKNIYVGPKPPAFITPGVFKVLQDNFNLQLVSSPEKDMKAILGK